MSKIRDLRGALEKREDKKIKHAIEGFFFFWLLYTLAWKRKEKKNISLLLKTSETYFFCISLSPPSFVSTTHSHSSCSFP